MPLEIFSYWYIQFCFWWHMWQSYYCDSCYKAE